MRDRQCALNHDATESVPIVSGVINKPTTVELCISPVYRRLADPDRAHLGSTHSSQDQDFTWPTRVQNLKSLALAVAEILHGV